MTIGKPIKYWVVFNDAALAKGNKFNPVFLFDELTLPRAIDRTKAYGRYTMSGRLSQLKPDRSNVFVLFRDRVLAIAEGAKPDLIQDRGLFHPFKRYALPVAAQIAYTEELRHKMVIPEPNRPALNKL